jgi:hypothetical protein
MPDFGNNFMSTLSRRAREFTHFEELLDVLKEVGRHAVGDLPQNQHRGMASPCMANIQQT